MGNSKRTKENKDILAKKNIKFLNRKIYNKLRKQTVEWENIYI